MRPEIANQLDPLAVIGPQFEIVILVMEVFVSTGIWILLADAYPLQIDRNAVLPA